MNTSVKNAVILGAVGAVLLVFGAYLLRPVINVQPAVTIERDITPPFAGIPGTVVDSNEFTIGGVTRVYKTASILRTATGTPCALQSPPATSTLITGGISFLTSSTSPTVVDIGRGTTAFSTTTERLQGSAFKVATSGQATIIASSSSFSSPFPPNHWFVVKMNVDTVASTLHGSGPTVTFSPTGQCNAVWERYR